MSVIGEVFESLRAMSLVQLLLAFIACTGYAIAQGGMFSSRTRQIGAGFSALGAVGFALESAEWMYAAMLLAFAVAGMGVFVMLAWAISSLITFVAARVPRTSDSSTPEIAQGTQGFDGLMQPEFVEPDLTGLQPIAARAAKRRRVEATQSL